MGNIYDTSKVAFRRFRDENNHPLFPYILLSLFCVPLIYQANSVSLGILVFATLVTFRKRNFSAELHLLLPVALYMLMALSALWTIDPHATGLALSKELPILIIPLCFIAAPKLDREQRHKIIRYYSFGMTLFCIFYMVRAAIRFAISGDSAVFFYHELVTIDVNAIHVSIFVSVAFFYFLAKRGKTPVEFASAAILFLTIFLLLSKNVIATVIVLIFVYGFFYSDVPKKKRMIALGVFIAFLTVFSLLPQTRERYMIEYNTITTDNTVNNTIGNGKDKVYNMSVGQAWNTQTFRQNDYFPGTAFRVYQFRIFCEIMREDNSYLQGAGLNASLVRIEQKAHEHNIYTGGPERGYLKNFHNQFVQNFAELGIFGLLLLVAMVWINLKNGVTAKDFVHISFAILMISLFLTESFLWRQRGVTFFAMMYCVFNSGLMQSRHRKE